MKKNISNNLYLLVILLMLFSCKTKKNSINPNKNSEEIPVAIKADFSKIVAKQANYSTFVTKAATQLAIDDKSFDVTLNIRIKKGEGIWVSATYIAGVEVARALITPDSLKIMDRVNNEYIKKPFSYIHEFTNNEIDYQTLEAVLVGNCIPFTLNDKSTVSQAKGTLTGQTNKMVYQIGFNEKLKPKSTLLVSEMNNQKLDVMITEFEELLNQLIAKNLSLTSNSGNKNVKLIMQYERTQLNQPVDFPFNVPKRFSVID